MLASGLLLVALLACLTVMVLMSVWQQRNSKGKLPPGPTPLPFIGNYLQLNTEQMYNSIMKISERYGPVFTIHLGPRRVVVLCGHDAVREALVDQAEEFSGRGEQATFNWVFKGYGVAFSNGERAKQLRRFSIATLRDFGVGKRGIEERIQEEAGFLIEALRGTHGANIDPTFFLSRTVCNVISSIVFGDRFEYEDKEFLSLLRMMLGSFQFTSTSMGQVTGCSPTGDAPITTCQLLPYLETGIPKRFPHPPPAKVHEEIDRVIGKNQQPKFEDRVKMPYMEAVIHEIQRFGNVIPMSLARRVNKDTKFRDFFLPKGTEVFPMLGSVLKDPKFFSNPQDFNPQHFLDEKGQFKKSDAFVPFSIGKRPLFAARPLLTPAGASLTQLPSVRCSLVFLQLGSSF
uniref:Cytochrome P450 family 2 subfamily A member 26 n=1 Tax=Mandrillus leucophaeus TaxID=9568 RepID=A0A2K6AFD3_MANLE